VHQANWVLLQKNITALDFVSWPLNEVRSKWNAVDIHEDAVVENFRLQAVAETAGVAPESSRR
jgi:hypothetical protein